MFRHILCPTDFSTAGEAPIQEALRLAGESSAKLTLLHVIQETALDDEDEEMGSFLRELEERAREKLQGLVPAGPEFEIVCSILRGNPAREILATAMDQDTDLIVIGSHGLTGVEAGPFGSTGQAVVLLSPKPVLVVKPEGYKPTLPED